MKRLSPESGVIRASVELLSTRDEDRPKGVKTASVDSDKMSPEESPGPSDAKRTKRITAAEKEDSMLPNLKPVPGNIIISYKVFTKFVIIISNHVLESFNL